MIVRRQSTIEGQLEQLSKRRVASPAAALASPETGAWVKPALLNSWAQYTDAAYSQVAYRVGRNGRVTIRGLVGKASGAPASAIFALPEGLRPIKHQLFVCIRDGSAERVDVRSNGEVVYQGAAATVGFLSLDPITFYPD